MSAVSAEEYVRERLSGQIPYHDHKAMERQRQHRGLEMLMDSENAM